MRSQRLTPHNDGPLIYCYGTRYVSSADCTVCRRGPLSLIPPYLANNCVACQFGPPLNLQYVNALSRCTLIHCRLLDQAVVRLSNHRRTLRSSTLKDMPSNPSLSVELGIHQINRCPYRFRLCIIS